jgi:polyphenol oxidase
MAAGIGVAGMPYVDQPNGLTILQFASLSQHGRLLQFVTTRTGGASQAPYDGLNLALHVGDEPSAVLRSRELLCASLDIPLDALTVAQQCHGSHVQVVTREMRGSGARAEATAIAATDAMVTSEPDICLVVLVADCVPILLFDPCRSVVGVAHAGWRGTVAGIARRTVETMASRFGSEPPDVCAALGPAIGPEDYEVGPEVAAEFERTFPEDAGNILRAASAGRAHVDLWAANRSQLIAVGVPADQIEPAAISTFRSTDRFYSARAADGPTGRFAAGVMFRG